MKTIVTTYTETLNNGDEVITQITEKKLLGITIMKRVSIQTIFYSLGFSYVPNVIVGTINPNEVNQLLIMDENDIRLRNKSALEVKAPINDVINAKHDYIQMIQEIESNQIALLY